MLSWRLKQFFSSIFFAKFYIHCAYFGFEPSESTSATMPDTFADRVDNYTAPEVTPPTKDQAAAMFKYHHEKAFPMSKVPKAAVNFAIYMNCWRSLLDRHNPKSLYGQYYSRSNMQNPLHLLPKDDVPEAFGRVRSRREHSEDEEVDLRTQYARGS